MPLGPRPPVPQAAPRRAWRIAGAAGRPWLVALAAFGAAAVAFPPWAGTAGPAAETRPAGPTVASGRAFRAWVPLGVELGWAPRAVPDAVLRRTGDGGRPAAGLFWETYAAAGAGPPRPPVGRAAWTRAFVGLPWAAGLPAAWSVFAAWRAVWGGPAGPSLRRRLARPWVAAFALVGLGVLGQEVVLPDPLGPHGTTAFVQVRRTPEDGFSPREVRATLRRLSPPDPDGGALWNPDWTATAACGVWWLAAVPVGFNLLTLARRGRPARDGAPR